MEKILIIQLTRMGDCIQTLPVLKLMKLRKPDARLSVLCVKEFSGPLARSRFVDRLITVEAAYIVRLRNGEAVEPVADIPELTERYDSVINLTHNWVGGFFCSVARSRFKSGRVNTEHPAGQVKTGWAKYLFASQKSRTQNLFNLVDMHAAMAGLAPEPVTDYMEIDGRERRSAAELLRACGWKSSGPLIAFQPGANQMHRAWPAECFALLAEGLLRRPGVQIALLGSAGERELTRSITSRVHGPVMDLAGKTGIAEIPAVLSLCAMLVSNDTGNIHMAAAAGTRSLGLFFSTAYFAETAPYGDGHLVLQAESPCSPCHVDEKCDRPICREAITVPAVQAAAERLLGFGGANDLQFPGISLYQSRFLSNGMLMYAPVQGAPIRERFLTGLLYRFLWEGALGIAPGAGPDTIEQLLGHAGPNVLKEQIDDAGAIFAAYESWYTCICASLQQADRDLRARPADLDRLKAAVQAIQGIETAVLSSGDSILKYYHLLHTAELDYSTPIELIHGAARSYSGLLATVRGFRHRLKVLEENVQGKV